MQLEASNTQTERATDIWRKHGHPLDPILAPRNIAIIGATESEGTVGRTLIENMRTAGYEGAIFPVNPKRSSILGLKAFSSVAAINEKIDLAVIATPAPTVPGLVREC